MAPEKIDFDEIAVEPFAEREHEFGVPDDVFVLLVRHIADLDNPVIRKTP